MANLKTYNLKNVSLIVGIYAISGYGEDGAIDIEWGADLGDSVVGLDGEVVFSPSNDPRAIMTVKVIQTSRAYRDLGSLVVAQKAAMESGLPLPGVVVTMIDPRTGDEIHAAQGVFLAQPAPSMGKTAGTREFKILLPDGANTVKHGLLNL